MNRTTARIGTGVAVIAVTLAASPALAGTSVGADKAQGRHHGNGGHGHSLRTITALDGPRGVDALGHGRTLVTETGGDFSLVIERKGKRAKVVRLGNLASEFPPAIARGRHGTVYLLTGASDAPPEDEPAPRLSAESVPKVAPAAGATLFKWRPGWKKPRQVADIGAYQADHPDPYDQEGFPEESNPYDLAVLRNGSVLVADAAGNDLLRVRPKGHISTVARLKPRVVTVPEGLPEIPPEQGGPLPPAGTPITAEAVATSVTVRGGYWYISELRGFPATPGTSQVWRVKAGTLNATCNPKYPKKGRCKRYADGLTSVTDLAAGKRGIYAVELSKKSWLQMEFGTPGADVGGLFLLDRGKRHTTKRELVKNRLTLPGGVDVARDQVRVVGPLFGPGALMKVR